jgi:hypothetical protein
VHSVTKSACAYKFHMRNFGTFVTLLPEILHVSLYLTKLHATKKYWGGRYSSTYLKLDTRWRRVVCFTIRPIHPWGKSSRFPLERWLRGSQRLSGRGGEEKKLHNCPCREVNHDRPARSLVSILTKYSASS